MKQLPKTMQRLALRCVAGAGLCTWLVATSVHAQGAPEDQGKGAAKHAAPGNTKSKAKKAKDTKAANDQQPSAAGGTGKPVAQPPAPPPPAPPAPPYCRLNEPEQPRGGRIDVLGERFGSAPVVRIAGKPARILLRKTDRISVQIPADSDGGEITLLDDGKVGSCGTLVIIGKNRE